MLSFESAKFLSGLFGLLPLVIIFIIAQRWKRKVKKALGQEHLINRLTENYSARLYTIKFITVAVALTSCIIAIANLRKPLSGDREPTAGIDIMIALDVSKSMLSSDIKPSRLERARQLISVLIDKLENNRLGLVLFAGQAYLQMPLTPDLAEAKMFLSNASTEAVPVQGTNVSEALQLCDNSLDTKEKKHKAVVLISDGEDHDPNADKTARQLSDDGIVVYTIGIGTAEGSPIMEPGTGSFKTDMNGKTVISKLNEAELKDIALRTEGNYYHMEHSLTTGNEVANALGNMEKKLIEAGGEKEYFSFAPFFIAFAILLLIIEVFTPETIKPGRKRKKILNEATQRLSV